ncbi:hypothetical protein ABPG72_013188 [Tetrahymena utriculariae]
MNERLNGSQIWFAVITNKHSNTNGGNQFFQVDKYLYPGLTYIIKISINVDGVWYIQYNQQTKFDNIYDLVVDPTDNYLQTLLLMVNNQKNLSQINQLNQYSIYNGCKDQGMEKVYLDNQNKQQFICIYCEIMKVSQNGVCENCQTDYFTECYPNYSLLKQNYWRANYTINPQNIFFCSNNPQSYVGGSGVGNELCYQGHIGAQFQDGDIKGTFWEDRYSLVRFFQCTECSGISQNTVFMVSNQFTQVDIISTFSNFSFLFYNPLSSPFFSLNCLISHYRPNESIGFSNILLTFLIPLPLCCLIALCPVCFYIVNKICFRRSLQMTFLSFIYIFITVFDSILLEKTLSSFFCLNLEKDKSYSLIYLSLECKSSDELQKIQYLSLIILITFLITLSLIIFLGQCNKDKD